MEGGSGAGAGTLTGKGLTIQMAEGDLCDVEEYYGEKGEQEKRRCGFYLYQTVGSEKGEAVYKSGLIDPGY